MYLQITLSFYKYSFPLINRNNALKSWPTTLSTLPMCTSNTYIHHPICIWTPTSSIEQLRVQLDSTRFWLFALAVYSINYRTHITSQFQRAAERLAGGTRSSTGLVSQQQCIKWTRQYGHPLSSHCLWQCSIF